LGGSVVCADFSGDGQQVATASSNHLVRVWDTRTGECLTPPARHPAPVSWLCLSPDGGRFVTGSRDQTARVWHARSDAAPVSLLLANGVGCAAFSPDGQRVVTASRDGIARVWDSRTGQLSLPPLRHDSSVLFAEFTGDGQRVVTACAGGTARFWHARTGRPLTPLLRHGDGPLMLRVNAPATLAASAATDTTLRVWELPTGQSLFTTGVQFLFTTGRQFWVVADAQFTAEGSRLVTACDDGRVRFWDVRTGLLVNQTTLFGGNLRSLQIAPDDHHVLTTSPDAARVWEAPLYAAPAPAWLPRLAEGVAGRRLDAQRQFEPVPVL